MIKRLSLIALLFVSLFSACSDEGDGKYKCSTCADEPEANAAYDNTGQGIYKGVLIGSTGTVKFDVANDGSTITAELTIDGHTITLTGSGQYFPDSGFQGSFTGTLDGGTVIIPFKVTNTGTVTVYTSTIPGHSNVFFSVLKEKSTHLVQAFEGTYTGGETGTFNMVMFRNSDGAGEWGVIARSDSDKIFTGNVRSDNQLVGGNGGQVEITGKVSGDNVSGDWKYILGATTKGTWTGKRTL